MHVGAENQIWIAIAIHVGHLSGAQERPHRKVVLEVMSLPRSFTGRRRLPPCECCSSLSVLSTFDGHNVISTVIVDVSNGKWVAGWKKPIGNEILGKTMGIIGLGRIGKEVAIRAKAFGMPVIAYDPYFDEAFASEHGVERCQSMDDVLHRANVVSLHCFLDENTRGMINTAKIAEMRDGVVVLNCARGELVETDCIVKALESGKVGGYGADVLDAEPPATDHPLLTANNCIVTSHIASRTHESVIRQALRATHNLVNFLKGDSDYIQANKWD